MAKPPFLLPEPKSTSFGDKALDFVFGPIEAPNLDSLIGPVQTGTGSQSLDSDIALRLSMMKEGPQDLPDSLKQWKDRIDQMAPDELDSQLEDAVRRSRDQLTNDALVGYSNNNDVQGGVDAVQEIQTQLEPGTGGYVDALTASLVAEWNNTTDPIIKAQIREEALKSQLGYILEKMGMVTDGHFSWKEFISLMGTFVPLRNMSDFTNVGKGLNPVSGYSYFKDLIFDFNADPTRPLNDQINQFKDVMGQLLAETDNPYLFQERAEAFINPYKRSGTKWGLIFDGVDLATLGFNPALTAARAASYIAASRKPIKILRDIGKTEDAAELAARAAIDPEVAKAAKVDKADAALTMTPFDGEQFDPRLTAGLAAETQKALVGQMARVMNTVREYVQENIKRFEWNLEEMKGKEQKFLDWARKNRFVQAVNIVNRDNTGFSAEVTIMRPTGNRTQIRSPLTRALIGLDEVDRDFSALQKAFDTLLAEKKATQEEIKSFMQMGDDAAADVPDSLYTKLADLDAQLAAADKWSELAAKRRTFEDLKYTAIRELQAERDALAEEIKDYLKMGDEAGVSPPQDKVDRLDAIDAILADNRMSFKLDPLEPDFQPVVEKINIKYTKDDWGKLDTEEWESGIMEGGSRFLNSPEITVDRMLRGVVAEARARDLSAATIAESLRKGLKEAWRGVGPGGRKNVGSILMQGDKDARDMYTVAELEEGIVTKEGLIRLKTVGEVRAYYAMREIFRELHGLEGTRIARDLETHGYRSFKFPDGEMGYAQATAPDMDFSGTTYYDLAQGRIVTTTRREIREKIDEGYRIYPLKIKRTEGTTSVTRVMAKQADLGDIPKNPLGYRPGYVPKVIDNVRFIGLEEFEATINGIKTTDRRITQFFDNYTDLAIWKATVRKAGGKPIWHRADQYLKIGENKSELESQIFGGLYDSKRTDQVIGWNGSGTEGERVGAYQALEAYANHVAITTPTHVFKERIVTKFMNTIKSWEKRNLPEKTHILSDPFDWSSPLSDNIQGAQRAYFKAFQDWVYDQMRIPSTESRLWNNMTNRIAEWIAPTRRTTNWDKARDLISRGSLNMNQRDITGVMRSMAFHATLGWFNPVQLFVQGMNVATLLAVHPLKTMKLAGEYMFLRATWLNKDIRVLNKTMEAIKAAGYGVKEEELMAKVIAFRKTGLWQNTKSTADAQSLMSGDNWLPVAGFKYLADKGLVFYREGERFNRWISWLWAADDFYKGRAFPKLIPDADIDEITKLSTKFSLNLDRANRAMWQKGAMSIPTQFLQVTAKFMEKMWYNVNRVETGWTATEKLKVLGGYAFMFGAAGVPFGQAMLNNLSEWAYSDEVGGLGDKGGKYIQKLQDGFIGYLINFSLGADVEISSRLSLVDSVSQIVGDIMDNQADIPSAVLGVFGELPNRLFKIVGRLAYLSTPMGWEGVNGDTAYEVMDESLKMLSSYRQARRAQILRNTMTLWTNNVVDFNGTAIRKLDDIEARHLYWAQMLGFSPAEIQDYYQTRMYNRITEKDLDDTAKVVIQLAQRIMVSDYYEGEVGGQRAKTQIAIVMADLNTLERRKVMGIVRKKLNDNNYALAKELVRAAENYTISKDLTVGPPWNSNTVGYPNRLGKD